MTYQYVTWIKIRFNEHDNEQAFVDAVRKKMRELIDEVGTNNAGSTMIPVIEIHWDGYLEGTDTVKKDTEKIIGEGWEDIIKDNE